MSFLLHTNKRLYLCFLFLKVRYNVLSGKPCEEPRLGPVRISMGTNQGHQASRQRAAGVQLFSGSLQLRYRWRSAQAKNVACCFCFHCRHGNLKLYFFYFSLTALSCILRLIILQWDFCLIQVVGTYPRRLVTFFSWHIIFVWISRTFARNKHPPLLLLHPPCQMYRYDARWLPAGLINAIWECRLARCWLCSHGNWLQPCMWPHEGHIKAGLQKSETESPQNVNDTVPQPSLTWKYTLSSICIIEYSQFFCVCVWCEHSS